MAGADRDDVSIPGLGDCIKEEWWWPRGNMRGAQYKPYFPPSATSPKEAEEWLEGEVEEWLLRRGHDDIRLYILL